MPDDQFPPGSPQDPAHAHFADPTPTADEPEVPTDVEISFEPIGASTPGQWPSTPEDIAIDLPGGGQYPDDIFGIDAGETTDAQVAFPDDAIAGGLADVEYAQPGESLPPLPPPAEPQNLADASIDPLPVAEPVVEDAMVAPIAPADRSDMFSVDDLMDEPAKPPATGGDMFSVDDLMDEPATPMPDAAPPASPAPLPAPAPLAMPGPIDDAVDPAMFEASIADVPVDQPPAEPLAQPAAGFFAEPVIEPLAAPIVESFTEPLAEPLTEPIAEPIADAAPAFEPISDSAPAFEPIAEQPFAEQPVAPELMQPIMEESVAVEPLTPDASAMPEGDILGPHGIIDSQAEMPASDFGFTDASVIDTPQPDAFDGGVFEPAVEPFAAVTPGDAVEATPAFEPMPSEPIETFEPAEAVMEQPPAPLEPESVINPYAQVSDEAEVIDPAMSAGTSFDLPVEDAVESAAAPAIVNPYAQVSDEAEVIDPAMSFSNSPGVDQTVDSAADLSSEYAAADSSGMAADDPFAPAEGYAQADAVYQAEPGVDPSMPPAYGSAMYGDSYDAYATPLPATDRTVSIAPPGMEAVAPEVLVVAGSKRSGSKRKRSKTDAQDDASAAASAAAMMQPDPAIAAGQYAPPPDAAAYAAPYPAVSDPTAASQQYAPAPEGQQYVPVPEGQPVPTAEDIAAMQAAAQYAASQQIAQPAAAPAKGKSKKGIGRKTSKQSKNPKAAKAQKGAKPPKPAKQGKSMTDSLLGTVEPGQRHKLFGIPIGKPTPLPGEASFELPASMPGNLPGEMAVNPPLQSIPLPPNDFAPAPPVPSVPEQIPVSAEVIESVEATAHARGKGKRGMGRKAPKQPKAAKPAKQSKTQKSPKQPKPAKQGKSMTDSLLGTVEPGQRHKLFGIPIGKPAPLPGEASFEMPAGLPGEIPGEMPSEWSGAAPGESIPPIAPETAFPAPSSQPPYVPVDRAPAPYVQPPGPPAPTVPPDDHAASFPPAPQMAPPSAFPEPLLPGQVSPGQVSPGPVSPGAAEQPPAFDQPVVAPDTMVAQSQSPAHPMAPTQPSPTFNPAPPPADGFPAPPNVMQPPPPADQFTAPQPFVPDAPVAAPEYATAQYPTPEFSAQDQAAPDYAAPEYAAPQYAAPEAPQDVQQAYVMPPAASEGPATSVATMQSAPSYLGGAAHAQQTAFPGGYSPDFPVAATAGGAAAVAHAAPEAAQDPYRDPSAGPQAVVELTPGAAPVYRLANWRQRVFAQLFDSIIVGGLAYLLTMLLGVNKANPDQVLTVAGVKITQVVVVILALTIYQAGFVAYNRGQTIGKRLMKLRVVREDGKRMDLVYGMARETLLKGVLAAATLGLFGLIDSIWPLIDKQNRALHDIVVKSRVIDESK